MNTPNGSAPRATTDLPAARFALRPLTVALMLLGTGRAFALPEDPTATFGTTTVTKTSATTLDIKQTSDKAGLDWQRFSIGANERVTVMQPGAASVLLNRVVGYDPSSILGQLVANGRVYLVNPNGIVFGAGSRVDVGGLVATTMSLSNQDVQSGAKLALTGGRASITNAGQINAPGGTVVLAAPQVVNSGGIDAARVGLVAATDVLVDVEGDGLLFFNVKASDVVTRLDQLGSVNAGSAELRAAARAGFADTVLNLEGVVRAHGLTEKGGQIVIGGGDGGDSGGIVRVAGTLDASSADGKGGGVTVTGEKILLTNTAVVDASGATGGGSIRVGGDFQGRNADVQNAAMVTVRNGAVLKADASVAGDGGRVIVWSDEATRFAGNISARGAGADGAGGFAEVSGKQHLAFSGLADLGAASGKTGTLLLDPDNLTIQASSPDIDGAQSSATNDLASATLAFGTFSGTDSVITSAAVVAQLAAAPNTAVVLQAGTDLTVASSINAGGSANAAGSSLTLQAGNNVVVNNGVAITTNNGAINLQANDNGGGTASASGRVSLGTGASLNAGSASITLSNNSSATANSLAGGNTLAGASLALTGDTSLGGALTLDLSGSSTLNSVLSGAGSLTKQGAGTLTLGAAETYTGGTTISAGTLALGGNNRLDDSGAVTVNGGTLALGANNDTIGALTLQSGSITGSGTLTAASAELQAGSVGATLASAATVTKTTAGSVTLDAGGSINADLTVSAGTLTANGTLGGASLAVTGGTLQLNSVAPATSVDVNGGTLAIGVDNALSSAAVVVTVGQTAAGTLDLAGHALAVGSFTLGEFSDANSVTAGTLNSTGDYSLGTGTVAAVLADPSAGTAAVTKTGGGTVVLTGANSYTGGTTISDGTLQIGATEGVNGSLGSGAVDIAAGGTLRFSRSDTTTVANAISGAGGLDKAGSGELTLTGGDGGLGRSGTTTIGKGTLVIADATSLGSGDIELGSASPTLAFTGDATLTNAINGLVTSTIEQRGAGSTLTLNTPTFTVANLLVTAGTMNVNGASTAGTLVVNGGAMNLNAASSATTVAVNGGTLNLGAADVIASDADVTVAQSGAATLNLAGFSNTVGSFTLGSSDGTHAGTLAGGAASTLTAGSYALNAGTIDANLGAGTATKATAGSVTLNGGRSLGGDVVVEAGTLTANGALGGTSLTVNGGTLALGATASVAATTIDINGGTLTLGASNLLDDGASVTVAATGAATLDLAGFSDTVNSLTLGSADGTHAGTLAGGATSTLTASSYALNAGTIDANLGAGTATKATAGSVTLDSGRSIGGDVVVDAGTLTANGTLGGANLTVNGGTLALGATASVSATTIDINAGTLTLGASNLLANTADVTVAATGAATLNLAGFSDTVGSLALGSSDGTHAGTLAGGSGSTLTAASYALNAGEINANLGAGTATKASAGSVTLDSGRSIGGNVVVDAGTLTANGTLGGSIITVNGGTLALGASDVLANTANVTVAKTGASAATLDMGVFTDTVASFTLGGATDASAGTLAGSGTLASTGGYALQSGTASANLGGSGAATKTGTGTVVLSGANAGHTGAIGITAGTLQIGSGTSGTAGSGAIAIGAGSTLRFSRSDATMVVNTITGAGTLDKAGTGNLTLTGDGSARSGTTNVGNGTLVIGGANSLAGSGTTTLADGSVLAFTVTTAPGAISGAGGTIEQRGAASTLTLGAGSSNVGTLLVTGGTMDVNGASTASTLTVNAGTMNLNAAAASAATVAINGGTLNLGADNLLADTASVSVGATGTATLNLAGFSDTVGGFTLGSSDGTHEGALAGGSSSTLTAGSYALRAGTIDANLGAGSATKSTTGTVVLNNNLGANLTVNDGALVAIGRLDGASVTVTGGTLDVFAPVAASTVNVNGGAIDVFGDDLFDHGASLTVASTTGVMASLALNDHPVTVGSFTLGGNDGDISHAGTVNPGGTLTAASYTLNVGTLGVDLGTGPATKTSAGSVTLFGNIGAELTVDDGTLNANGTLAGTGITVNGGTLVLGSTASVAATTIDINGGTLTLGASNLLADTASVTVAATGAATLNLAGFSDTVGSFTLGSSDGTHAGTLAGGATSTLTATTYALNAGTINANLGTGTATKATAGSVTLNSGRSIAADVVVTAGTLTANGTLDGANLDITGGTLQLGANDRINNSATVTVAGSGATLDLGGNNALVGSFTLGSGDGSQGGVLAGGGTLTSNSGYALNAGSLDANLGSGTATKASAATVTLGSSSSIDGDVAVNAGTLTANGTLGGANLVINDGTLALNGTAAATTVTINGGTLALGANNALAAGAAVTVAQTGASTATLDLGAHNQTVAGFTLGGGSDADAGRLAGSGTLTSTGGYALKSGTVTGNLGNGAATKSTAGTVTLTGTLGAAATSTADSTLSVDAGTLALGAANRIGDHSGVTVNGGTLDIGAVTDTVGAFTLASGNLAGTGTLTATTYDLQSGTVDANLGNGTASKTTGGTVTLAGTLGAAATRTTDSTLSVDAGTLTLASADRIGDHVGVTVNGGTLDIGAVTDTVGAFTLASGNLAGTGTLTAATYDLQSGTVDANLGNGAASKTTGGSVTLAGTLGAAATSTTDSTLSVDAGTLTLASADRLGDHAGITVNGGTLAIGAFNDTVGSFTLGAGTIAGSSGTLSSGDGYALQSGSVDANLGAGTATKSSAGSVALTVGHGIAGPVVVNAGTLTANGTLGGDAITVNGGALALNAAAAATTIAINGGTLALGASNLLADGASVTVAKSGASAATLNLGANTDTVGNFTLGGADDNSAGVITGSGTLTSAGGYALKAGTVGANLGANTATKTGAGSVTLNAGRSIGGDVVVNDGTLIANGTLAGGAIAVNGGTLALNAAAAATTLGITGGTLQLGADNLLSDAASVTVAKTGATAATLNMGGFTDTVGNFTLGSGDGSQVGALAGGGTLTSNGGYTLNAGSLDANLGSGTATKASAGTVTLGSSSSIDGDVAVNAGTLTANGTLGGANLVVNAGTLALNGTAAATTVTINGGTLALGASNALAAGAAVTVAQTGASTATLDLGAHNQTIAGFTLGAGSTADAGRLAGSGTLTSTGGYALKSGTVTGNLGNGTATKSTAGTVTLTGTLGAAATSTADSTLNIDAGVLALASNNRLGDHTGVTINGGALALGATTDTVDTFTLAGGDISGGGTLTAATYDLQSGTVDANLGNGAASKTTAGGVALTAGHTIGADLVVSAGTLTTSGTLGGANLAVTGGTLDVGAQVAATTVDVNGGTLTVHGADLFNHGANLAVAATAAASATLALNGNAVNVGSFALGDSAGSHAGTVGAGTINAASYALRAGTIDANLGSGIATKSSAGSVTQNGSNAAALTVGAGTLTANGALTGASITVTGGTLALNATAAAPTITINGGTLTLGANNRLNDAASVTVTQTGATAATLNMAGFTDTVGSVTLGNGDGSQTGAIAGGGTLTAATYAANAGSIDANLGVGALVKAGSGGVTLAAGRNIAGTVDVEAGTLTANGTLGGNAITVNGGTLALNAAAAATTIAINGGTLQLGASNLLADGTSVTVAKSGATAATLNLGANTDTVGNFTLGGADDNSAGVITGSGTLTSTGGYALKAGTVGANLGAGTATKTGAGSVTLTAGHNIAAPVVVNAGTLTTAGTLGGGSITVNGGTLALGNSAAATTIEITGGTLALDASNVLADGATVTVRQASPASAATLALGASSDSITRVVLGGDGTLAGSGRITGSGTLTATASNGYALEAGRVSAKLGAGSLTKTTTGTIVLDGNSGASRFEVQDGALTLNGTSAATTVVASGGAFTLGADNRLTATPDVSVSGGTLYLAGHTVATGALHLSAGSIEAGRASGDTTTSVGSNATLTGSAYDMVNGSVSASLGGAAALTKSGAGTVELTGSSSYTGGTTVTGGTLRLNNAGNNALADSGAVTVAEASSATPAVLDIASASETVGAVTLTAGSITGNALTASAYAVSSGAISARLDGSAALTKSGSGTVELTGVNGYTGGTTVAGGTLRLNNAAGTALADGGAVTVATSGATPAVLDIASAAETVGAVTLTSGSITGNNLTGSRYDVASGAISANLAGPGALTKTGAGSVTLSGANSYTGLTTVAGGDLRLAGGAAIADNSAVTVQAGARLVLDASETLGDLAISGGTLTTDITVPGGAAARPASAGGSGTPLLTINAGHTATLNNALIAADLAGAIVNAGGATTLEAHLASGTLDITGGSVALASDNRLGDGVAVTARNAGSKLDIGSHSDTVATLALRDGATLNGSGTLTAATTTLAAATVNANLGAGLLVNESGNSTLAGTSAANLRVAGGKLTTASAERIADTASVAVDAGATLALGGAETLGAVSNAGTLTAAGNLTVATLVNSGALTTTGNLTATGALAGQTDAALNGRAISSTGTVALAAGSTVSTAAGDQFYDNGSATVRSITGSDITLSAPTHAITVGDASATGSGSGGSFANQLTVTARRVSLSNYGSLVIRGTIGDATGTTVNAGSGAVIRNRASGAASGTTLGTSGVTAPAADQMLVLIDSGNGSSLATDGDLTVNGLTHLAGATKMTAAGKVFLLGSINVLNGDLTIISTATQTAAGELLLDDGKTRALVYPGSTQNGGVKLKVATDTITDGGTGSIIVGVVPAVGSTTNVLNGQLNLQASGGGSISLTSATNNFAGGYVSALSGTAGTSFVLPAAGATEQTLSRVLIDTRAGLHVRGADHGIASGTTIDPGIEADLVRLTALSITSPTGTNAPLPSPIVARLPYWDQSGIDPTQQLAGLELAASGIGGEPGVPLPNSFGVSSDVGINVKIGAGSIVSGGSASSGGYLIVKPFDLTRGTDTTIFLNSDLKAGGTYRLFYPGAGLLSYVPVAYNGVLPSTPQALGALSAIIAIIESARREQFESTVRTENVAPRLRSGVIAEVGPGRAATVGSGGIRNPESCDPQEGSLTCR